MGANTFGKPVGQIGQDRSACDDRLRLIAFAVRNADNQGDYYDGLAEKVGKTCTASDDLLHQMGDPAESSTRIALDALAGKSCSPIATGSVAMARRTAPTRMKLLVPERPNVAQRETPGTF